MNTILLEIVAAIGLAIATGLYGVHVGERSGANRVQVAWDADRAAISQTAADAKAKADQAELSALQNDGVIYANLQTESAAIAADRDSLAGRLRHALGLATSCGSLQPTASIPGPAPSGSPSGAGYVDDAIAAALTECRLNSAQLDALEAQIRPQL